MGVRERQGQKIVGKKGATTEVTDVLERGGAVGFIADHDHTVSDDMRFVQLTPPGSACSIALGRGIVTSSPGSVQGLQLVVSDITAAHDELAARGVEVSDVQDFPWGSFVFFSDPDGNGWSVQQPPA